MPAIRLTHYTLPSKGLTQEWQPFNFGLDSGDICAIETDSASSARLFLRALATLITPESGTYFFANDRVTFGDYRNLLPYRRKIGYIAPDAAMISNRTVRENLLWGRYYFEDSLALALEPEVEDLCRRFNIYGQLDKRPAELSPRDLRVAIAIREITKAPAVLAMEMPEDFIGTGDVDAFVQVLSDSVIPSAGIVFFSHHATFNTIFANQRVSIADGRLAVTPR